MSCWDCGSDANSACSQCRRAKCSRHMSGRTSVEVDTGYRIAGWRVTRAEQGPPPVCELCLAHPGADHQLAARRVEEAVDPAEIAAWWDRARDLSKGVAWRRLVDTAAFGEPTHDIVVVGIESRGKGMSRKVTGLAVRDRTPAWLIKDSVSYRYPGGDRGDGRPKLHTGIADAYVTGLRNPDGFDPEGPSFWVPWDWPIEGWSKVIGDPMKPDARKPTAPLRYEKSPVVFAVPPGASPQTRKVGFVGDRQHELVRASGVYVQPTDWKTRKVFHEPTVGTSSRWPVGWRFRYTEVIRALAASPG